MGDSFLTPEEIRALVSGLEPETEQEQVPREQTKTAAIAFPAETGAEKGKAKAVSFTPLGEGAVIPAAHGLENFAAVPFNLQIVLGESVLTIGDLLKLQEGSVIVLDRLAGENGFLLMNGKPLAEGEVVVINDCFALRVNSLGDDGVKETAAEGE
jgi:flagellar motor switch protein FliN/FliY